MPVLGEWWQARRKEIYAKNELLHSFSVYMNTEKHGGAVARQHSGLEISAVAIVSELKLDRLPLNASPETLEISAEGMFVTVDLGTPLQRRVPVGVHNAKYEIVLHNAPDKHLGAPFSGTFLTSLRAIRDYYAQLLFEAEAKLASAG